MRTTWTRTEGSHSTTLIPTRRLAVRLALLAVVRVTSYSPAVAAVVAATVKVTASATATDRPRILRMAVDAAALLTVTSVDVPEIEVDVILLTVSPALRYSAYDCLPFSRVKAFIKCHQVLRSLPPVGALCNRFGYCLRSLTHYPAERSHALALE